MNKGVLDIGNTRIKAAVFNQHGHLTEHAYFLTLVNAIEWLKSHQVISILSASVAQAELPPIQNIDTYSLTYKSQLPFQNLYQTPETLGVDRIAAMAEAAFAFPNEAVLVFDIGTCMTIDFLHPDGRYYGGNISPGIEMRWKSMHVMTQRLPQGSKEDYDGLMGSNTAAALASGVLDGMRFEIEGYMNHFGQMYPELKIVLCGGDLAHFDKPYKYKIFAAPDFVLKGLYHLLLLNEKKD
jgi:type III pantothenate kinase